ncbi:MAG: hypothetical protein ACE5JK_06420, partial [Candidatus Omnitrophota bacterium]
MRNRLLDLCERTGSSVFFDKPLSAHSTISIGGKASAWFVPSSLEALQEARLFLQESGTHAIVIGNASNVLM